MRTKEGKCGIILTIIVFEDAWYNGDMEPHRSNVNLDFFGFFSFVYTPDILIYVLCVPENILVFENTKRNGYINFRVHLLGCDIEELISLSLFSCFLGSNYKASFVGKLGRIRKVNPHGWCLIL